MEITAGNLVFCKVDFSPFRNILISQLFNFQVFHIEFPAGNHLQSHTAALGTAEIFPVRIPLMPAVEAPEHRRNRLDRELGMLCSGALRRDREKLPDAVGNDAGILSDPQTDLKHSVEFVFFRLGFHYADNVLRDCEFVHALSVEAAEAGVDTGNDQSRIRYGVSAKHERDGRGVLVGRNMDADTVVGETAVADYIEGAKCTAVTAQSDALLEVASGSVDACVIDATMAAAMTGEGTSYADLAVAAELSNEEYGVAFRANSDLCAKFNEFKKEITDNGKLKELADKYCLTLVG